LETGTPVCDGLAANCRRVHRVRLHQPIPGGQSTRCWIWSSPWTMPPSDLFGLSGRGGKRCLDLSRAGRSDRG